MTRSLVLALLLGSAVVLAQSAPSLKDLSFLSGTWSANAAAGSAGASASGSYTFQEELRGHVLARHSAYGSCAGPADFNCEHNDLLYVYEDEPGAPLKAIYFDNEGHVIFYDVTTPAPNTAMFLSPSTRPGPQYRLMYELKDGVLMGRFQMRMPGQSEFRSYLEWSGKRLTQ